MGLRELSSILWRERQLLELLLFKLEEEQLLLAAGSTRWLPRATKEVEMVLEEIRYTELERSVEVDRVAAEVGLPPGPSLRALAEVAPSPWGGMLTEQRQAFLSLTEEIVGLVQTNRELLSRGQAAVREVMASLGENRSDPYGDTPYPGAAYAHRRTADVRTERPLFIDKAL